MSMLVVLLGLVIALVIFVGVTKATANVPGAAGLRIAAGLAGIPGRALLVPAVHAGLQVDRLGHGG